MRIVLGLSYHGAAYQGWQSQASGQTVQDRLEAALSQVAAHPVRTVCAGRTDAGVHALMQVVHFETEAPRKIGAWVRGVNALLPPDIAVQWAQPVPVEFHCRASASARRYVYVLLESPVRPSVEHDRVGWVFQRLQAEPMHAAAQYLLGEHDFSAFRASECQALSPVKHLRRLAITRCGAYWRFEFEANAFLHHMIRNIMGCLVWIGQGVREPRWMQQVLQARQREAAAPTFSAAGLYFLGPRYPARWGLPDRTAAFDGLPGGPL
ncbi:MAG: tRNA pseudouridine(38-40) synthase TruA [Rhodoferax sp.]